MEVLKRSVIWVLATLSLIGYWLMAYQFKRTDHLAMLTVYVLLFVIGIWLTVRLGKKKKLWPVLFITGLCFRITFLWVNPHLSDDYFRFTWDGELLVEGESPFSFKPQEYREYFQGDSLKLRKFKELYLAHSEEFPEGINSKNYHSVYPPVSQMVFAVSSLIGSPNRGNIVVMRLLMLLAEVISFFLIRRLLLAKAKALWLAGFYWLNPLVIIELTGNLHFEGFAITFILLALHYLGQKKTSAAGIALSLAICTKLNPLFLIGAVFKKIDLKKLMLFGALSVGLSLIAFALILDIETFWNFKNSSGLYFTWFEFNTGFFYLARELGMSLAGVDITSKISLIFPTITVLLFGKLLLSADKMGIPERLLLLYVVYFAFTPIVHPWYISLLIPLALLSGKLYPILWSLLIFFTYTAYGDVYGESYWIIGIEYTLVYLLMYAEYKGNSEIINKFKELLFGAANQ